MNRLIIVGNGFDLAHGLETSYEHFIFWYLKSKIVQVLKTRINHSDNIIDVIANNEINHYDGSINKVCDIKGLFIDINLHWGSSLGVHFLHSSKNKNDTNKSVKIVVKSQFFANLLNKESNWTDIENSYYRLIINSLNRNVAPRINVKSLNDQFETLKVELVNYLKEIDDDFLLDNKSTITKKYIEIFETNILNQFEIPVIHNALKTKIEKTVFLNFNYTNVIDRYKQLLNSDHFSEIQIHGNINNHGTVVFGFGDELDKHYQDIEDLNQNEYFRHIKSFKYLENSNYRKLMKFVHDSEKLEVLVMGHSLGLSDRTMLNQIFEEENVKNIRLFYHANQKKNDLVEKSHSISRHFKNKARMRLVIEPHSKSQPMPQFND